MAKESTVEPRTDSQPPEQNPSPKPTPARVDPPEGSPRGRRADWIGWLIVLLAFLALNCFLQIYCYWIFLPYPRW